MISISEFIDKVKNKKLNIAVFGDSVLDIYDNGVVNRISPEFPVPILSSPTEQMIYRPGGAANVAYQFKHIPNVNVYLFSFLDKENKHHFSHGFNTNYCFSPYKYKTPKKIRYFSGDTQLLRRDIETNFTEDKFFREERENIFQAFKAQPNIFDVVILSNYNKGFFDNKLASDIITLCNKFSIPTIVDSKSKPNMWKNATVFKPNSKEAFEMTGEHEWSSQCKVLKEITGCKSIVITQEGNGVVGMCEDCTFEERPKVVSRDVNSTIGAGDCFSAILALGIGHKVAFQESCKYAFEAGVHYVKEKHNRPITLFDLHRRIDPLHAKIIDMQTLHDLKYKVFDNSISWAFSNGCFDLLHSGHIATLQYAKSLGDKLIVAINSDESVRRLKGNSRPIQPLEERQQVIAALECVDFVVSFEEDTPYKLVRCLKPDYIIKGAHYKNETVAGSDISELKLADIVPGNSTTNIIEKILASNK